MKCATPASAVDSRRDPASTYAATATDREPGRRAEMTRGPAGSSVRWNIVRDGSPSAAGRAETVGRDCDGRRPQPVLPTAARAGRRGRRCAL